MSMPGSIEISEGVYLPSNILEFTFARSSGPGGQSVNKLNTKAILTVRMADLRCYLPEDTYERLKMQARNRISLDGVLQIMDQQSRSQHTNRLNCLERLSEMITRAKERPKRRRKTKRSKGSVRRRLDAKKRRSNTKQLRQKPEDD